MALIKSTILAQISGSVNGITFAHNAGGAYMRNRSLPSNPGTDRQDQVRTAMTTLAKMWSESLTEEQRVAWRLYGAAVTVINKIGDPISLSGIAAFIRVNLFRMASLGLAPTLAVPEYETGSGDPIPAYVSSELNVVSTTLDLTVQLTADATGYNAIAYFSGILSPGVKFYKGPYASYAAGVVQTDPTQILITGPTGYAIGQSVAAKIILYKVDSSLKVWEVYTDPQVIDA